MMLSTSPRTLLLCLATALAVVPAATVHAQPAAALGKPLPDGSMPAGTVSVRVVAGSPANPVVGADVTLLVNDKPQSARTDASGRATFPNLPAGATVQAKIKDAEDKDVSSDPFPVPSAGGARVMLTTKPFTGGAGPAAPMMGGGAGGGMPEPRQISGQPRPDGNTPAGTYVVRLSYNDLSGPAPAGVPVTLVSYSVDEKVEVLTGKSDASGHATFPDLDVSGKKVYFALATLPRGTGVDRLMALPVQPDGQAGMRTMLSGAKKDSTEPNIDELASGQAIPTPAGKVRVTLEGFPSPNAPVRLIDATTKQVIGQTTAVADVSNAQVQSGSKLEPATDLAPGTIEVQLHGGTRGTNDAIPDIDVSFVPADGSPAAKPLTSRTAKDGWFSTTIPTDKPQRAIYTVKGKQFTSDPIDVSKAGGRLDVVVQWSEGRPQAMFDVAVKPGMVLYAESDIAGKLAGTYRSMPFLPIEQTGTHVGIVVYPRVMVRFSLRAMIEDQLLAVQGRWVIDNNSWFPYQSDPDGMLIPLPRGHKGGVVADMNQSDVAVAPGEGLRVLRPIPPGQKSFVAGFSLPVDGGDVRWALDLPLGTFQSDIHIRQTPGMVVQGLPPDTKGAVKPGKDGNDYFMIEDITIPKGRSMTMTIVGLPSPAGWKIWAPRVIGVLVVLLMVAGVGFALLVRRGKQPVPGAAARRAALLDELVELERTGKNPARREQVIAELEKLWIP
ncbi:MAG TPA: carboxypeptidase-like regulatory domain-containing protein [Kofleriaceae bacterium]|nr:carboxypeptidase-like regulatory domain-containing protein [Kofleriaceae bacterium]